MKPVFVSHAWADRELVGRFVDTILMRGCGLSAEDVFYSSGEDTGIPDGESLMKFVRDATEQSILVIAIISPVYQTRPVCIAELGAGWAKGGALFPVMTPGLPRESLQGVIPDMLVRYLNEDGPLDNLHQRVSDVTGKTTTTTTFNLAKRSWLKLLPELAANLEQPDIPTAEEVAKLRAGVAESEAMLDEAVGELESLRKTVKELHAAKTKEEADAVMRKAGGKSEMEEISHLATHARVKLLSLPSIVREAILPFATRDYGYLEWPDREPDGDDGRVRAAAKALSEGYLVEARDGLVPDTEFSEDTREAVEAVLAVKDWMEGERTDRFEHDFKSEYRFAPDITRERVWDALFT